MHKFSTITHVDAREIRSKPKQKLSSNPSPRTKGRTTPRARSKMTIRIIIIDEENI